MGGISIVLVVLVAFLAGMEGILDEFQFHQPLVACTLIGIVTGHPTEGIMLGGSLQMIALGWANVGAAVAPDAALASVASAIIRVKGLGDGHIKIAFTRIDTRLLHGQVATTVTKMVNPDRIIVCSDNVAHDDLRKSMIVQAAPPGVKVHVVPISKIIEVSKDVRFGDTKAMLLFETPQDLLRALEGGVDIKQVNLGSMAHSQGKVVVTNAVAMDADDVECIEKIASMGVKFDVRKVPADNPENFDAIMNKAKSELAAQGQ